MTGSLQDVGPQTTVFGIQLSEFIRRASVRQPEYKAVLEACQLSVERIEATAEAILTGEQKNAAKQAALFVNEFCAPGGATRPEVRALFIEIKKHYKKK